MICRMLRPLDRRWLVNGWAPGDSALHKALISEYQRIHDILKTPTAKHFAIAIDRSARLHCKTATADGGHVLVALSASV